MGDTNNKSDFSLVSILSFLWRWKKILLIVFILAFIVSLIISFLITPKYDSTLIVIPSQTGSISRMVLVPSHYTKELMDYGKEDDCEHLIQILNSSTIIGNVCNHFNLMKHYNINPNLPYKNTRLYKEYIKNITIKRTENMAVKITVRDKDPEIAMKIANYIGEQYDELSNSMKQERTAKAFKIVNDTRNQLKEEIRMLEDSMTQIHKMGVISYDNISDRFAQQLAIAAAQGNSAAITRLNKYIGDIAEYGSAYLALRGTLDLKRENMKELDLKFYEVQADAEQTFPFKYIVDEPYIADQKSFPDRILIVLISTLSALLMAVFVLLFIEKWKFIKDEFKKKV